MLKTSSSFPSSCFCPSAAITDDNDNDMNPSPSKSPVAQAPPTPPSGKPNVTSSVYQTTELGLISFTWHTNLIGRSLQIQFQLPNQQQDNIISSTETSSTPTPTASVSASAGVSPPPAAAAAACFNLDIQPFLFWRSKNGSKTFNFTCNKDSSSSKSESESNTVQIYWSFSRAKFTSDHPEPKSGFYVALVLDGVMILLVGDSPNQAYNKTKTEKISKKKRSQKQQQVLVLRREHVCASRFYSTKVRFGGKNRQISIDCRIGGGGDGDGGDGEDDGDREAKLCFSIDGEEVVEIKRLKWKFRGNQRIDIDGKYPVHISWDVYNWLFQSQSQSSSSSTSSPPSPGGGVNAGVFMFRFENPLEDEEDEEEEEMIHGDDEKKFMSGGKMNRFGIHSFGLKKRSANNSSLSSSMSSSISSSTSCSSSSVMDWANMEDAELDNNNGPPGFSLLVYAWKN